MVANRKLTLELAYGLLLPAGLLTAISLIALFSIDLTKDSTPLAFRPVTQVVAVALGILAVILIHRVDLGRLARRAPIMYWIGLGLLLVVELVGQTAHGATRWLDIGPLSLQPTEFMKLSTVILLARLLSRHLPLSSLSTWVLSAIYMLLPAALVAIQPDLGGAIIYVAVWICMILASPLPKKFIAVTALIVAVAAILSLPLLADYQRTRLESFFSPLEDSQGSGYNSQQALIAVGSGQLFGQGLDGGSQSSLRFLPSDHTDFIFAVVAEKLGFVGAGLVIAALAAIVTTTLNAAGRARSAFAGYLLVGLGSLIAVESIVNLGMNLGWLPVVGLPLPFVSYGGSHIVANFIALGLIAAAARPRRDLKFA